MYAYAWDEAAARRHRRRNRLHSAMLLGGMAALLAACGWTIAGAEGVFWAVAAGVFSLMLGPQVTPGLVLRLYRAQPLPRWTLPELHAVLDEICAAAGLDRVPALYYVPSPMLNAFAVGNARAAAIAVTDGLLRSLDLRELAGVLAHEISHVRNDDIWIMGLADTIARLTRVMSFFGMMLLAFALPGAMLAGAEVPWLLIGLLVFAPTIAALMQLALARTREFEADLEAAQLTGDPAGLASALRKLERRGGRMWESILMPGRRADPSLLRTHPPTEERVARLLSLQVPVRLRTLPITLTVPYDRPVRRFWW